jgi:glycosyltransferase involved in cell wall biosynthesis
VASRTPTLSVIVPNYNHARFLPECLESVLAQSYRPAEIIVIDDCSTDDSVQVIEAFVRREPRLRLVRNERNRGVVYSCNRLVELASGDFVYSLGADDKILPGLFERSMALLAEHPQAGLACALVRRIDEAGRDLGLHPMPLITNRPRFFAPDEVRRLLCRHYDLWMDLSTFFRRDALLEAGGFLADLGWLCDAFARQIMALRYGVCLLPEALTCWRQVATRFSLTQRASLESARAIQECSLRLMRTTYRDLFPAEYVAMHEKRCRYWVGLAVGQQLHREPEGSLQGLEQVLSPPTLLDRLLLALLRRGIRLPLRALRVYLYLRLRKISWALLKGIVVAWASRPRPVERPA